MSGTPRQDIEPTYVFDITKDITLLIDKGENNSHEAKVNLENVCTFC